MNILDEFSLPAADIAYPLWAKSETTRSLYKSVSEEAESITRQIKSGKILKKNARRIICRKIALSNGLDPSTVHERRQPELAKYINNVNDELAELWESTCKSVYKPGVKIPRQKLQSEIQQLKSKVKHLENLRLVEAFTAAIEKNMVSNQRDLIATIESLKSEITELRKKNSTLQEQLRSMIRLV